MAYKDKTTQIILALIVLAGVFAAGYYFNKHQQKDTVIDINVGGKNFSATIDQ